MFLFLVLIVLSSISFHWVICLWLKKSEEIFFQFLLKFVSTFYKNCLHLWLLFGLCIIFSVHSVHRVVLFYVVSLSFKRQTFSFTASSTNLPDSLLLLFHLPLNVNHPKKRSVIFYSDGSNRKIFLQKNGCQTYTFYFAQSSVEHKMILFLLSTFSELFLGFYSKTQYQLRDFAQILKNFKNKNLA